ncbi:MAG TPA: DegQ family serine endoprotease [Candidatus Didemnitutus sp.]|nr:DegQ family serine endoprotease [Candidatus Didemnitutus sp.]
MNAFLSHPTVRRSAYWTGGLLGAAALLAAVYGAPEVNPALSVKHDSQPVNRGQLEQASFANVVKRVSPSVVKITVQTKSHEISANEQGLDLDNPFFRQFFGGRMPQMRTEPETGLGSGVIISSDGYIATNNHVVANADHVTVTLDDGRDLTARVVGRDPLTDVAVVHVDAKDLPAVTFADTSKVEVGDRVLAIGNPFGIGETVTSGIVSAMGRRIGILSDVRGYENFIQTDAAINPGNSGGALVDVDGRLIGLNTAILSRSGGSQGVGLAVPADLVSRVADSLVKNGKVVRGYLGVSVQDITPALADSFGLKSRKGALIAQVEPNSPAAKAGLKEGDVITSVNGSAVTDSNKLTLDVSGYAPGTKVSLDVLRDGKTEQVAATTGNRPSRFGGSTEQVAPATDDEGVLNGVAVDDLTPESRREMNLPAQLHGAVITEVAPDSASARAGLSAGDVILEINRQRVTSAQQAIDLSAKAESKKTLVKLWSRGSTIFVVVDETAGDKAAS